MQGKGVSAPILSINWQDLIRFKRTFTDPVPERTEHSFAEAGITMQHGRAHFVDRTAVHVGDDTLVGHHVVIATGARHASLGIPGEEHLTTGTQFLELDDLPPRIVFVGGGYIAFEFAHIAARAGVRVQILHRGARPLAKFDPDLVSQLVRATSGSLAKCCGNVIQGNTKNHCYPKGSSQNTHSVSSHCPTPASVHRTRTPRTAASEPRSQ